MDTRVELIVVDRTLNMIGSIMINADKCTGPVIVGDTNISCD